ncbi:hypothetical protein TPHA_0C01520 [Tetrapisispora phaffii CBS 4417]|uniref:AAA+ ATPase domain-containing protein n=1 Tax=Tetrapisispora phaffii (strain ATCC 24235 / CBS 4417 / NBRC 1672 / NRRL Y-8282 / UCD 70-5) TaxID=1071381 RepID=G8BRD2_TETPH|nr:hypothetical protein TPHA_0C01520 [Tetrapisispora phaffii CBS 4417]CCE62308.1 hypothetical protein TPHA_0C01520 [Tetrapisispora phaffii CBS 4417]
MIHMYRKEGLLLSRNLSNIAFKRGISSSIQSQFTSLTLIKTTKLPNLTNRASVINILNHSRSFHVSSYTNFKNTQYALKQDNSNDNSNGDKKKDQQDNKGKNSKKSGQNEDEPPNIMNYFKSREFLNTMLLSIGFSFMFAMTSSSGDNNLNEPLTFQDFKIKYLEKGLVKKIYVINKYLVEAELISALSTGNNPTIVSFTIGSVPVFEEEMEAVQNKLNISAKDRIPIIFTDRYSLFHYLFPFVPTLILLGGLYYITKKMNPGGANPNMGGSGGIFGVGKSKAKLFNKETDIKVAFKDVAGCNEAKQEIMEFVHFLKNPKKYTDLGAKIPRGAILSGPPGTGKTLLAKATAGEAGVPFLSVSGSEFVEMFVGVGASRVRDLFEQARTMAPSIIFIDEIDAIGKERGKGGALGGANDEREATLNQLLVEMDGFQTSDQVIVLAGTNRPDVLDKALMRPGRFDRHIEIDPPDVEGRKSIYLVHLSKLNLDPSFLKTKHDKEMLAGKLAALTPGFAGADIANACNEAALIAARYNDEYVEMRHFEQAIERVIAGLEKKSRVLSPQEKKTVAFHEAGHAVCGWYLEYADPLLKVSIIPRGQGALGYAQYLPDDRYLYTEEQFKHRMVMTLGGRVSEELHFPSVTSGAHDDFNKVTNMARSMVTALGMSPKLGYVCYDTDANQGGYQVNKPFSEQTERTIDLEIKRIIDEAHEICKKLLTENIEKVDKVANELLTKESITREDMIRLLGPRPFPERNAAFEKYLDPQGANSQIAKNPKDPEGNISPAPN